MIPSQRIVHCSIITDCCIAALQHYRIIAALRHSLFSPLKQCFPISDGLTQNRHRVKTHFICVRFMRFAGPVEVLRTRSPRDRAKTISWGYATNLRRQSKMLRKGVIPSNRRRNTIKSAGDRDLAGQPLRGQTGRCWDQARTSPSRASHWFLRLRISGRMAMNRRANRGSKWCPAPAVRLATIFSIGQLSL